MKSLFSFIVTPVGQRYDNSIDVNGKELIINTKIETFKAVNNLAVVVSTPMAFETDIKVGDTVVIHHNVFRRFYGTKGEQKNSRSYFTEDLYFCDVDQIYLYKTDKEWKTFGCLLYTSPSPRDRQKSRMPSSA